MKKMVEKIKIRDFMNLPKDDIEAKKALMTMDKEDIIDRHLSKAKMGNRRDLKMFITVAVCIIIISVCFAYITSWMLIYSDFCGKTAQLNITQIIEFCYG